MNDPEGGLARKRSSNGVRPDLGVSNLGSLYLTWSQGVHLQQYALTGYPVDL